ncbi:MAG: hypothetical protein HY293_14660 [Planctomycetes bacterium]|nr:hypothetical protein [Planctomycetota bacterium]
MKRAVLAIALVCAAAGLAQPQGKKTNMVPGQGIDWQGDWAAAVDEATARNVPIHIAVHKDN